MKTIITTAGLLALSLQPQAVRWITMFRTRWGLVNVNIGLALILGSSWLCAQVLHPSVCACVRARARGLTLSTGNVTVSPCRLSTLGVAQGGFYWVSAVYHPQRRPGSLFWQGDSCLRGGVCCCFRAHAQCGNSSHGSSWQWQASLCHFLITKVSANTFPLTLRGIVTFEKIWNVCF